MKLKLTYIGKRVTTNGKLMQVFAHQKKTLTWVGIKYVIIGNVYEANKTGDQITLSTKPESKGRAPHATDEKILEWETQEAADIAVAVTARAKQKEARYRALLEKMEPLRAPISKLSYLEKKAFLEYFLDKFTYTQLPNTKKLKRQNHVLYWHNKRLTRALTREQRKAEKRKKK